MRAALIGLGLGLALACNANAQNLERYSAHLQGFNAAGAAVATNATGEAQVDVIDGGTAIKFRVNVAGIRNLWMAHIHVSPSPVSVTSPAGPPAFWFTGGPPPQATLSETVNGRLAEGFIITSSDVVSWNPGDPLNGTVQGLVAAIREGRASVIVHTNDPSGNTAPGTQGNSPPGELRGTLR